MSEYQPIQNGRVHVMHPSTCAAFSHHDKIPVSNTTSYQDALTGGWEATDLSKHFFSNQNIAYLQSKIIEGVYQMSNKQLNVGPQNSEQLKIIMRSIYLQCAAHHPTNIKQQVAKLNKKVLEYSIPNVYGSAISHNIYLKDVSTLATPLNLPQVDSQFKSLEYAHRGL